MKMTFIHKEIWLLTTMGGFQRANLYDKQIPPNEQTRKKFREALHTFIKELAITQYTKDVSVKKHINNIKSISEFTAKSKFSYMLYKGKLNFGVSQKLLNLYLKYLWCIDAIATPPHFPVDRIIQVILNKETKKQGLPKRAITSWTQMETEKEYMEVIEFANKIIPFTGYMNLAQLELDLFDRN